MLESSHCLLVLPYISYIWVETNYLSVVLKATIFYYTFDMSIRQDVNKVNPRLCGNNSSSSWGVLKSCVSSVSLFAWTEGYNAWYKGFIIHLTTIKSYFTAPWPDFVMLYLLRMENERYLYSNVRLLSNWWPKTLTIRDEKGLVLILKHAIHVPP